MVFFKLIFDQNVDFRQISIIDKNLDFLPKFQFLAKTLIFRQNFEFWLKSCLTKISISEQNFDVNQNLKEDFDVNPNVDFWPKSWPQKLQLCKALTKIWIFDKNVDGWPKFGFLTKIFMFDQNLDFWLKYLCLTKIWIFD